MSSDQPSLTSPNVAYGYDYVPKLGKLLPKTGGVPGVEYIQVCTANAKPAQDQGWGPVHGAFLYTITGPKGSADMLLACRGTPDASRSNDSGACMMNLDDDIYRLTGIWRGLLPVELQEEFNVDEYGKNIIIDEVKDKTDKSTVKSTVKSTAATSSSSSPSPKEVEGKPITKSKAKSPTKSKAKSPTTVTTSSLAAAISGAS